MDYNLPNIVKNYLTVAKNCEILPIKKEVIISYEFINQGISTVDINGLKLESGERYNTFFAIVKDDTSYRIIFESSTMVKKLLVIKNQLVGVKNYLYE